MKHMFLIFFMLVNVYANDMQFLQEFIEKNKSTLFKLEGYEEIHPLCMAALYEDKVALDALVKQGHNPKDSLINKKDLLAFVLENPYQEAKMFCSEKDDVSAEFVEYIIKQYAFDVNKVATKDEILYLNLALRSHSKNATQKVKLLLEHGANPNKLNKGVYPLQFVSMDKSISEKVLLLLKAGASLNSQDKDGDTPLHQLIYNIHQNNKMIEKYKNSKGNKVKITTTKDRNIQEILDNAFGEEYYYKDALYATYNENIKNAISLLIKSGADVSLKNKKGISAEELLQTIR